MADINSQMGASLQQAEMARQRAMADMQRQVEEMQRRAAWHQHIAERAAEAGRFVGGAALGAGAHMYSNAATGAAYLYSNSVTQKQQAASALGFGHMSLHGPDSRGIPGPYLSAGQSFGGLLYEGGLGKALNVATGGLFFRDVNQITGLPSQLVGQQARDELALRAQSVGAAFGQALPFSAHLGYRFDDLRAGTQRDIARRLSYVTGTASSLAGGRGISATGAIAAGAARTLERVGEEYDRAKGFSLSKEEELDIRSATMNLMSVTQGEKFARMSSSERDADLAKMRGIVHNLIDNLRVSAKEAVALTKEFGEFFSAENMLDVSSAVQAAVSSGAGGALTNTQLNKLVFQAQTAGRKLGMSDTQAQRYGETFLNERGAILAQRRAGLLSYGDMYMYGGANADEAAMLMAQANRRLGLQYGADPSIGMMYANKSGTRTMNELASGSNKGGIFGFMSAQANVAAADPYAALRARFDPDAKERQSSTGLMAAYNQAKQVADFSTVFGPGADTKEGRANRRAVAIAEFARATGITDDTEAARQYDRMARAEKMLGGSKQAFIYNQMQQLAPYAMDVDEAKGLTDRVLKSVGGDINAFMEKPEYERRAIIERERRFNYKASESDKEEYVNSRMRKGQVVGGAIGAAVGGLAGMVGGPAVGVGAAQIGVPGGMAIGARIMRRSAEEDIASGKAEMDMLGLTDLQAPDLSALAPTAGSAAIITGAAIGSGAGPIGTVIGGAIGGAVAVGLGMIDPEDDVEAVVKKAMASGMTHHDINAMLESGGVGNFVVTANGDLVDRDNPQDSNATTRFGRADKLKEVLGAKLTEVHKTGKLDEATIRGRSKQVAADKIRSLSGKSDVDFLAEADVVRQTGIRKDESGKLHMDASVLMEDPESLKQIQEALFSSGQEDLYKKLSGEDVDQGVAISTFMKEASQESIEQLQYLRGSRAASTLSSTRGQSATNPMFVEVVKDRSD